MRVFPLTYIHATDWVLLAQNIGEYCSIDETQLCEDVYTILSNKAGHGKKGTVDIPASELGKVKEITMDFSDSMYNIAKQCFPNADIVIDCFHIVQRLCGGLEEMRLKFKRLTVTESRKEAVAFAKNEDRKARQRLYYRKRHKKNPKEFRGRKRIRKRQYNPVELCNGDTKVELLTRSRNLLSQSGEKWDEHKKERARLLFERYPQLREGYSLICKIRSVFNPHCAVSM